MHSFPILLQIFQFQQPPRPPARTTGGTTAAPGAFDPVPLAPVLKSGSCGCAELKPRCCGGRSGGSAPRNAHAGFLDHPSGVRWLETRKCGMFPRARPISSEGG